MRNLILSSIALIMVSVAVCKADDIDTAYTVCAMVDYTGVMSTDCEISGGKRTLNLSFAADVQTARQVCQMIAAVSRDKGFIFDKPWKVVITSPYSNGNPIASCPLPTRSK